MRCLVFLQVNPRIDDVDLQNLLQLEGGSTGEVECEGRGHWINGGRYCERQAW